jgi:hypothetical protein
MAKLNNDTDKRPINHTKYIFGRLGCSISDWWPWRARQGNGGLWCPSVTTRPLVRLYKSFWCPSLERRHPLKYLLLRFLRDQFYARSSPSLYQHDIRLSDWASLLVRAPQPILARDSPTISAPISINWGIDAISCGGASLTSTIWHGNSNQPPPPLLHENSGHPPPRRDGGT